MFICKWKMKNIGWSPKKQKQIYLIIFSAILDIAVEFHSLKYAESAAKMVTVLHLR